MEVNTSNYGILLNEKDIKLHRMWFIEMCSLIGVRAIHRAPKKDKTYTTYAEIDTNYECPEVVGCIFNEHPDQKTLRKLGWVSELMENAVLISVPYDTKGLQRGSLFIIPSAIDNSQGRVFRVDMMSTISIYPASITCSLVPEFENTFDDALYDHSDNSFNLLNEETEED